jgi:hypothetical protein
MPKLCRRGLQLPDGAPNAEPDRAALVVLLLGKLIYPPRGDNLGIWSMLLHEQRGGAPDVDVGDHGRLS